MPLADVFIQSKEEQNQAKEPAIFDISSARCIWPRLN